MTVIEGGGSECIKCNSYRVYQGECKDCGTDQKKWYRENMLSNLKQYGFKKSFFFNKWTFGDLVVKPYKESTNMKLFIDGEEKIINHYGNYDSFEKFMDRLIGKQNKRNLIIDEILK